MAKTPAKKLVFVIDEYGRILEKKFMHKLLSELFEKALKVQKVEAVVASGPTINTCVYLLDQLTGRDIDEWEVIYLHGSKYPPVLLTKEDKADLIALLPIFKGTSAEAVYKILMDARAFIQFD